MKPIIQNALDALESRLRALVASSQALLEGRLEGKLAQIAIPDSFVGSRFLTGSGVYVPTPGTNHIWVRGIGGGGGGGGTNVSSGVGAAGSGNSGWFGEFTTVVTLSGTYSCGVGGAAGTSAPGDGGTGGTSTITIDGVLRSLGGGVGGTGTAGGTTGLTGPGPGAQPTTGNVGSFDFINFGEAAPVAWYSTATFFSTVGGMGPFGPPGIALGPITQPGNNGTRGSGASGGCGVAVGSSIGGVGGDGLWVIHEYQ